MLGLFYIYFELGKIFHGIGGWWLNYWTEMSCNASLAGAGYFPELLITFRNHSVPVEISLVFPYIPASVLCCVTKLLFIGTYARHHTRWHYFLYLTTSNNNKTHPCSSFYKCPNMYPLIHPHRFLGCVCQSKMATHDFLSEDICNQNTAN